MFWHHFRAWCRFVIAAHIVTILSIPAASSEDDPQLEKDFETRLAHYLDLEMRDFLAEMTVREKCLLQMLRNITAEIELRGAQFQSPHLRRGRLEHESRHLIEQYSRELQHLVTLAEEITALKSSAEAAGDLESWRRLRTLREQLIESMESEAPTRAALSSQTQAANLLREQHAEVNSFVEMYEKLASLRERAEAQGNQPLLQHIAALQDSIRHALGASESPQTDRLAAAYFEEAESLVATLKELDRLHSRALTLAPEVSIDIQELRRSILRLLPSRLPLLLGYDQMILDEDYIPQLVDEWKMHQSVVHTVRLTRYRIVRQSLLKSATPTQLRRMRARELYDALHNYASGAYRLARMQFDRLLQDYGDAHDDLADLHFYRAESFYAQELHDGAERDYLALVSEYPDSEHLGASLLRLLQIHERKPERGEFSGIFRLVQANRSKIDPQRLDQCLYLAGYVQLEDGDIRTAEETLAAISPDFSDYWGAQLLLGIARASQGEYAEAMTLFQELVEAQPANAFIRDSAHLRLGYLYYEQGEFDLALQNFRQVSPAFAEHDQTLLAIAWTHLKLKEHARAVETVELSREYYLDSETLYEGLMLAAHARHLLDNPDAAQEDLRYIANARSVFELSNRYRAERQLILAQINTLDRLERRALQQNDRGTFQIVDSYRSRLQDALLHFEVHGARGNVVLENLVAERTKILSQLEQLERLIAIAEGSQQEEALKLAQKQRSRLMKVLQLYHSEPKTRGRHYFLDYPLATKKGMAGHRSQIMADLGSEIDREKTRLKSTLAQVSALQKELQQYAGFNGEAKLELMHAELSQLYDRTQWLQSWLWENDTPAPQTDFNRYADFSGFGMSDATFAAIQQKEEVIAELSSNKHAIAQLILDRKKQLEDRVRAYKAKIRRLERENREEHLQQELEERQEYLQESYFDTTDEALPESEQPDPDSESKQQK